MDSSKKAELIEKLADLEHEQWIEWSKAVQEEVSPERAARWKTFQVPYDQLDEPTKELDREWARKVLEVIEPFVSKAEGSKELITILKSQYPNLVRCYRITILF